MIIKIRSENETRQKLKKKQIKTNVKMSIFCLKHICKTLLSFYYFYNDDIKVILS